MDYEKLKLKKYRPSCMRIKVPLVTISTIGFRFNVASSKYINRHHKYCEIYFDKNEMVIAIKPTNALSENVLRICRSKGANPFICTQDFLKSTGLAEKLKFPGKHKGLRVIPTWDEKKKMFLLDLKPLIGG